MKRISVIGTVTILAVFCLIRVELVAKEPVEKSKPMAEPVAEAVIEYPLAVMGNLGVEYEPPTEANMAKLPPYQIEPPDVVQIDVSGKDGSSVITGLYLVGPEGTVNLREYGSVNISDKTVPQAKKALVKHLTEKIESLSKSPSKLPFTGKIESSTVHVEVAAYNSKVYYIITKADKSKGEKGDSVARLPCTGKETVRDVMKQVRGLDQELLSAAKSVRISRPILGGHGSLDLSVNMKAIRDGSSKHNLQIFPGDRLFVDSSRDGSSKHNFQIFPGDRLFVDSSVREKPVTYVPAYQKQPKAQLSRYQVHTKLTQKDADGRKKVLFASPVVGMGVDADGDSSPPLVIVYSVKEVLSKIRQERGLSGPGAQAFLEGLLKRRVDNPARREINKLVLLKNDEEMVINASRAGHKQVAEMLDAFHKFGTAKIEIQVRFVTLPAEELQRALPDWTVSPLDVSELPGPTRAVQPAAFDQPLGNHEGTRVARAQLLIERDLPVRFRIVDEELGAKLLDRWQAHARTNILQAPKVTVFNGQTVLVSDTSQKPFVVGIKEVGPEEHQPQIRIFSEGTTLQLRPVTDQSGSVHLDFAITYSEVRGVDVVSFVRTAGQPPTSTIQVPEIATARTEGGAMLKQGQWLLLGGLDCKDQTAKTEVIAVSWKACD